MFNKNKCMTHYILNRALTNTILKGQFKLLLIYIHLIKTRTKHSMDQHNPQDFEVRVRKLTQDLITAGSMLQESYSKPLY